MQVWQLILRQIPLLYQAHALYINVVCVSLNHLHLHIRLANVNIYQIYLHSSVQLFWGV
jgi:hypothetical protein